MNPSDIKTMTDMTLLAVNGFTVLIALNNIVQGRNTMPLWLQLMNSATGGLGLMGCVWYGAKITKHIFTVP